MKLRYLASCVALPALVLGLSACQSTQSRSSELEAQGGGLAKTEKTDVGAQNRKIDVLDKVLLTDQYGTALVVTMSNKSAEGLADAPIDVNVKDQKGKSVYRNNIVGIEPTLQQVPVMKANSEVVWVHDQILATGVPKSVDVTVGDAPKRLPSELPEIEVSEPEINVDPTSGIEAVGTVSNKSDIEQTSIILYAVARKNGKIVAAGRGLIPKLKVGGKTETYHIFFIGNPTGADVTVTAPPVNLE